ncbi:cysteine--tRNA ligase [Chelatococcus sp. SYSU_G07232]|uniref:Cysteine--tRNA ligase n=1 Tax=Chelatococcus albus TaxID=3047466 RepID=A0ABT7AKG9_9HYPH|nr:cysteine--tRNA ligase [Chelatococcus sp. SYSU_G07232]MDJ1159859.1 cysteine--tRNA ligase [Chelatococcus sp. SYSU_G07232]
MVASLTLYNTLTRTKEDFRPIDPKNVRMYVCGPTVYDFAHIGNARPIIVFDLLFRLLRHLYGEAAVTYVRNITDVDDKINARAARDYPDVPLNDAIRDVTRKTEKQFHDDIRALGVLMPEEVNLPGEPPRFLEPRATEHIEDMKMLIERLVARGVAYVAEEHVLFSVAAMDRLARVPRYGSLARRSLDEMLAGARVDVAPYKRDPMDFVLWKPSKENEPAWPSPAGIATPGRPGWHIECSAMSWRHLVAAFAGRIACEDPALSNTFDIHAGGIDLVFPHHENEIAQSCCAFDVPRMANLWMHNGFLQVEGEKMSKSLGNFVTIHDALKDWPGEVVRFNMLRTHYRQPIDWTVKGLEESEKILGDWSLLLDGVASDTLAPAVVDALCDDLNTPKAIAELHHFDRVGDRAALVGSLRALGFLRETRRDWEARRRAASGLDPAEVDRLILARAAARKAKNWAESDRLRDELAAMGVVLKDNKDGTTTWEVAR